MAHVRAIATGVLRFAIAMAVGLFLLMVGTSALLFTRAHEWQGIVFVLGLLIVWAAAIRWAVQGKLSMFDRAAGALAAAASAVTLAGVAIAGVFVLSGVAILWVLAHFGAGPEAISLFERLGMETLGVLALTQAGIAASVGAAWLLWRRGRGR